MKRKYRIQKKIRDHKKKVRREEKKNPKSKKAKLVPIPDQCPFKEDILNEIAHVKSQEKAIMQEKWEAAMESKKQAALEAQREADAEMEEEPTSLNDLVNNAQSRQNKHDIWASTSESHDFSKGYRSENSLKAYYKEFRKVVEAADVVLEVVDARDPLGTRCVQVEEAVRQSNGKKKLVVVLNKADLVPTENLQKWLQYLRKSVPAIAFKASTQKQKRNLSRRSVKKRWSQKETNVSPCVGAEILMSLLNNYCRNNGIKTSIHVGIVGLPNVGKSSIINSLKRSKACTVGSFPGVTRIAQLVELDKKIKLLDSPGIVFDGAAKGKGSDFDATAVLKNAVNVQGIEDPLTPATAILHRASKEQIMTLYNVPEFETPEEFFIAFAEKSGRLRKGGVPDPRLAAVQLLDDWNKGVIKYFTHPPETTETHISASIVTEAAAEFDLDAMKDAEAEVFVQIECAKEKDKLDLKPFGLEPSEPVVLTERKRKSDVEVDDAMEDGSDDSEDDKDDNELVGESVTVVAEKKKKIDRGESKRTSNKDAKKEKKLMSLEGNLKLNLHKKQSFKKLKKMQARNSRHASSLAGVLENFSLGSTGDDSYDFATDFTS